MAWAVSLSKGAEDDLESLHAYIALNRSRQEADALLDALLTKCDSLESFPSRGSVPGELAALGVHEFRQTLLGLYRIIYRIEGKSVVILLIADGRRDMRMLVQHRLLTR